MTDDDRIEAPVTNEELYVELQKIGILVYLSTALVCFAGAYVAFSTHTTTGVIFGGSLVLGTAWILFRGFSMWYDGRANTVYNALPWASVDEPVTELEDRLTASTRADGGEEVSNDG